MVILVKQLFNQSLNLEKQVLNPTDFLQMQHIRSFKPDVIVATEQQDCLSVLSLAIESNIAYALYEPNLDEIEALLLKNILDPSAHYGKLIYFKEHINQCSERHAHLLETFKQYGQLVLGGGFDDVIEQMAFESIYMGVQII
jgi:hypothetical protein